MNAIDQAEFHFSPTVGLAVGVMVGFLVFAVALEPDVGPVPPGPQETVRRPSSGSLRSSWCIPALPSESLS
jgi:hypothetical protein